MSLTQDAATGVRWNAISMVGMTVLQIVTLAVLARLLPPSDFGLLAMLILVTGFAAVLATMGLGEALVQRAHTTREQLNSLYWANVGLGLVTFALVWLSAPLVSSAFGEPLLTGMLPAIGSVFIVNSLSSQFQALLQKALRFRPLALINLAGALGGSVVAVVLAIAGYGVWSLIWGQIINASVRTLLLMGIAVAERWLPSLEFRLSTIKGYLSFGAYVLGSNTLNYIVSRSDQLIIGATLGPQALGYYSMAFNLVVRPITLINPVITQVAFPVLARVQDDVERMKRGYLRMLNILSSANSPLLIGSAAIAPIAIPLVLGQKWSPIVPLVQILAIYALIRSMGNAGGAFILAAGQARWGFYWNLGLAGFVPVLVLAGVQMGGILGVSWSLVVLQLSLFFVWYGLIVRRLVGKCFGPYVASAGLPALFAAAMGAVVFGLSSLATGYVGLGGLIVVGATTYVGLYWVFQRDTLVAMMRLLPFLRTAK